MQVAQLTLKGNIAMMGKGVEMMVTAAIKAAGIDPEDLMNKVNNLMGNVSSELARFGDRLDSIDKRLDLIEQRLTCDCQQVKNPAQVELTLIENTSGVENDQ